MPGWLKQVLIAVGGLVIVLAWWTIRGPGEDKTVRVEGIPAQVWDGTQGPLEVRAKVNQPAELSISFERQKPGSTQDLDHDHIEATQNLTPGEYTVSVKVPPKTYAHVELQIHKPSVGASFTWSVLVGGRVIYEHGDTLEKPLEEGYGFFDNIDLDDVVAAEPEIAPAAAAAAPAEYGGDEDASEGD